MNIDAPAFTISEAAALVSMQPATVSSWVREGLIGWKTDAMAEIAGATTVLSVRTVTALAIANAFRKQGMKPELACKAGSKFANVADVNPQGPNRRPGEVFEPENKALTALVVYPGGRIMIFPTSGKGSLSFEEIMLRHEGKLDGASCLVVNHLVRSVRDAAENKATD